MTSKDEYIRVEQVATMLGVTARYAHKACHKANVQQRQAGKRVLYHAGDVEKLAEAIGAAYRTPEPPAPEPEPEAQPIIPTTNDVLAATLHDQGEKLERAYHRIGYLEREIEQQQRLLPDDADEIRTRAAVADHLQAENERLRAELDAARATIDEIARQRLQADQQAIAPQQESPRRPLWRRLWGR
jgi:chromosome segregation ATPase